MTVNDRLEGMSAWTWSVWTDLPQGVRADLAVQRQAASFLTVHLGNPIPSPALFEKIGTRLRAVRD